ncbi:MAG: hypothetical protein Q8L66_15680 [Caulobacter sp.]|nr:hypothetical protein [Caulobacter sp.]
MTRFTALIVAATLAAAPAMAQDAAPAAPAAEAAAPETVAPDPDVYQVLRSGDRQMSCEAIGNEANTLNAELQSEQAEAAKKARKAKTGRGLMGGATGGVLAGAARYGLGRGMMGGAFSPMVAQAAVSATDSVAASAGRAVAEGGDVDAPTGVSPKQQRMNHLLGLYREKKC